MADTTSSALLSNAASTPEDPILAALPPATDYITYLAILDYNLTSSNISTLNNLLRTDDGTLAQEIGWDLLSIVLRLLPSNSEEAQACLDLIANRGNPREVVVKVAEELERLGQEEDDDDLPTFAGEAPRIHFGDMKLQGMPDSESLAHTEEKEDYDLATEEMKFSALITMLAALHPRIKTKHPSRFLSTSLPAALGAYRRLSMSTSTTLAFLDTLSKLSPKQKPSLPPRVPIAVTTSEADIPVPDPEADSEGVSEDFLTERAINLRLLQAVLTEVVQEYASNTSELMPSKTTALRIKHEPQSLPSWRKIPVETVQSPSPAVEHFCKTANDLILPLTSTELFTQAGKLSDQPEETSDEVKDYPTEPSDIPFSEIGLILLLALSDPPAVPFNVIDKLFSQPEFSSAITIADAGLSLLYTYLMIDSVNHDAESLGTAFVACKEVMVVNPDSEVRDNAHHIASHILHSTLDRTRRLEEIHKLIMLEKYNPEIVRNRGTIKAIGVEWLKDEIWPMTPTQEFIWRLSAQDHGCAIEEVDWVRLFQSPGIPVLVEAGSADDSVDANIARVSDELPFYIALLNVACLLVSDKAWSESLHKDVKTALQNFLTVVEKWRDVLLKQIPRRGEGENDLSIPDIFALDDACTRLRTVLEKGEPAVVNSGVATGT